MIMCMDVIFNCENFIFIKKYNFSIFYIFKCEFFIIKCFMYFIDNF